MSSIDQAASSTTSVLASTREIDALLFASERPNVASAWHGHVAFAHWLVSVVRPAVVVELGTHSGASFAAFCNAAKRLNLDTRCFAVDTWQGDEHAGYYPDEVYVDLSTFIRSNFDDRSQLLRCFFDEAVERFAELSIDILHIDGLHTYEAVKHDFETWKSKLSAKAVILFHDTIVKERGFGVHQFWDELLHQYPGFSFHHSAGLGVLAYGHEVDDEIRQLCSRNGEDAEIIRRRFGVASESAYVNGLHLIGARLPTFRGKNIASNGQATQSSFQFTPGPTAGNALNGNKTGGAAFHTSLETNPWWMVQFAQIEDFTKIVVYNRLDPQCRERSKELEVRISEDGEVWQMVHQHAGLAAFGGVDGHPLVISGHYRAAFVKISLNAHNYLHLDEVEVYQED